MRVALTGATGYIGACLAAGSLRRGWEVTCLSRRDDGGVRTRAAVTAALRGFGASEVEAALARLSVVSWEAGEGVPGAAVEDLRRTDALWHCAAHMSLSLAQLERALEVNVRGTLALHEAWSAARGGEGRFFHVSTAYVGGFAADVVREEVLHAPRLKSSYLVSKWSAELALAAAAREPGRAPVSLVRPTLVGAHSQTAWYGGKPFGIHIYLAALALLKRLGFASVRLDLPPEALHNYLPIDDFVENALSLTTATVREPVFVAHCTGTDVSSRAVVEPAAATLGMRIDFGAPLAMGDRLLESLTRVARPIAGTGNFRFEDERLRSVLGSSFRFTEVTEERLGRFVDQYLRSPELASAPRGANGRFARHVSRLAGAIDRIPGSILPDASRWALCDGVVRRAMRRS